jgi:TatD DNase family protein
MGVHPWYIDERTHKSELEKLKIASVKKNVLAIGECGLDRVCEVSFRLQENVFREQIMWANQIAKPLIIHCVRAHKECLNILKETGNIMPAIFHGFCNKWETAATILENGHFLSFGHSLNNPAMELVFAATPIDRIFLETDDRSLSVMDIYQKAASIKNISPDQLNSQIRKNIHFTFNMQLP